MSNKELKEDILLVYTSPAFPPDEIKLTDLVFYGKDSKGDYLVINGQKKYKDIEFTKAFYTPKDCKWEELK